MKKRLLVLSISLIVFIVAVVLIVVLVHRPASAPYEAGIPSQPIPNDEHYVNVTQDMKFIRNPDFPTGYSNPLPHLPVPQHPFMAPNGRNGMHCDPYMTDTYEVGGPLGVSPQVNSTYRGWEECATVTFDGQGRIITVCMDFRGPTILLLDPLTLNELASYTLPPRHADWEQDPIGPLEDTSGGAYFYLDNQDRVVVATHNHTIEIVDFVDSSASFQQVREYDLTGHVVPKELPERDKVGSVLPDWEGRLWYVTRYGMVGTVDPDSGQVRTTELAGEEIQNSFTVGEDGVYIVSDYAFYRFHADEDGAPVVDWRVEYDRGTQRKVGMINQGSGTTPNLFGDLVAIGDNAEPRMNMIFYHRANGSEVCRIPVFEDGLSGSDNAPIGLARAVDGGTQYSLIIENNYGYANFMTTTYGESTVGGVTRIDVIPDGNGSYACQAVWASPEISLTCVPKLSLDSGLVYLYTKEPRADELDAWYFTAVDFESGQMVYRVLTGTGLGYNNNYAPITLGPQGGTAYVGALFGLICIRDASP